MSAQEDNAIHEMISAFAIGCMDKANFMQFKDYLTDGGEFPKGELGEMQNIVTMIPIILELETPDHEIKDRVAKKLIGMKEEIKTKIIEEKKKTTRPLRKTTWIDPRSTKNTSTFTSASEKVKTELPANKKLPTSTSAYQFGDDEAALLSAGEKPKDKLPAPVKKTLPDEPKRMEQIPQVEAPKPLFSSQAPEKQQNVPREKGSSSAMGWIAMLLTIILFSIVGYYTFITTDSLRTQLDDLKDEVTQLKSQQSTANNFINNYTSLIEFFNYKDITIYNFDSAAQTDKASAQLLLTFSQKEGLIQFKNAKPLQSNESYQIWAISKGQPYSLGFYQPGGGEYIKITSFPFLPKEKIDSFKITIEPSGGSQSPSPNVYLIYSPAGAVKNRTF